jgi:hypothetical protein
MLTVPAALAGKVAWPEVAAAQVISVDHHTR